MAHLFKTFFGFEMSANDTELRVLLLEKAVNINLVLSFTVFTNVSSTLNISNECDSLFVPENSTAHNSISLHDTLTAVVSKTLYDLVKFVNLFETDNVSVEIFDVLDYERLSITPLE
jgi:hypothetical protein